MSWPYWGTCDSSAPYKPALHLILFRHFFVISLFFRNICLMTVNSPSYQLPLESRWGPCVYESGGWACVYTCSSNLLRMGQLEFTGVHKSFFYETVSQARALAYDLVTSLQIHRQITFLKDALRDTPNQMGPWKILCLPFILHLQSFSSICSSAMREMLWGFIKFSSGDRWLRISNLKSENCL